MTSLSTLRGRLAPACLAIALGAAAALPPAGSAAQGVAGPYLAAEQAATRHDVAAAAERYASALARRPDDVMLLEKALLHHVGADRFAEAVALARRLEAHEPGRHLAVLTLAVDALERGDAEAATGALASGADDGAVFVTRLLSGWVAYAGGDAEAARAAFAKIGEEGLGGNAGQFLATFHGALVEIAEGEDETAVAMLEQAREEAGSGTRRLAMALAGARARLGRTEAARGGLEDRLSQSFSDPALAALDREIAEGAAPDPIVRSAAEGAAEALYGLAQYFVRNPPELMGLAYARLATRLDPGHVDAHLLIAEFLIEREQYDLAIAAYDAVPAAAPEGLDAWTGRARALEGKGEEQAAVDALREAVARWPEEIDAHRALGDLLRRASRFEESAVAYDGAIALIDEPETRHWPLYYQRGISLERSKQWERAEADFKRALELQPDQPLVLNYLGYSWVEMGVNLAEAQRMIERAVEQRPEDGYIVDSLGWVLYRLGDFEGAVKHLGRAVELRPVDPIINDHYGDALWMVGRRTEAAFQWRRALSFEPDEEEVVERIRRKLEVGLDVVLEEEAAAGKPAIIGQHGEPVTPANDGG